MAWSFCQSYVTRDEGLKHLVPEEPLQVIPNLVGEICPLIVHGQKYPFDRQSRIVGATDSHERVEELGNAFQSKILALDGDENGVGSDERVEGEEIEGWGAVEDDIAKLVVNRLKLFREQVFTMVVVDKLNRRSNHVAVGGDEVKALDGGFEDQVMDWLIHHQGVIK